uniref:SAP domain-containing protein n=1 Tax=Physcomitrium patens TaxID=3218 RepID=A0A7I4D2F8_PHYPA
MKDINLNDLPPKQLKQLCIEHGIRTAGVKREVLVRLLCTKLHHAASHPFRLTTSSCHTSEDPQISTNVRGESAEKASTKSTFQRQSLSSLVFVDGPLTDDKPKWSEKHISSSPTLSRKTILTKSNLSRARRSDLLHKKVDDGLSPLYKLPQDLLPQKCDGSPAKSRGNVGAREGNVKKTSTRVKHPDGYLRVKLNEIPEVLKSADVHPEAATTARATENGASVTAAGSIDLDSYCSCSVTEIATDARHHVLSEESDLNDNRSVSCEMVNESLMQASIDTTDSDGAELVTGNLESNSGDSLLVDQETRRPVSEKLSVAHISDALLRIKLLESFNIFSTSIGNPNIGRQLTVAEAGDGFISAYSQSPDHASNHEISRLQGSEAEHVGDASTNSDTTQLNQVAPDILLLDGPNDYDDFGNHENWRVTLSTANEDADNTKHGDIKDGKIIRYPSDSILNGIQDSKPFPSELDSKKNVTKWGCVSALNDISEDASIKEVNDICSLPELKLAEGSEIGHSLRQNIDRMNWLPQTQFKATPPEMVASDIEATNAENEHGAAGSHFSIPFHLDSPRFSDESLESGVVVNVSQDTIERSVYNEEGIPANCTESFLRGACEVTESTSPAPAERERSRSFNCTQEILDGLSDENKAAAFNLQISEEGEERLGVRSACEGHEDTCVLIQAQALAGVAASSTDLKEHESRHQTLLVQDAVNLQGDRHSLEKNYADPASDTFEKAYEDTAATSHIGKREKILTVGLKMVIVVGTLTVGILKFRTSKRKLEDKS